MRATLASTESGVKEGEEQEGKHRFSGFMKKNLHGASLMLMVSSASGAMPKDASQNSTV